MYFVKRGSTYHDVAGASFRDLMDGKLAQLPGERATLSDWANHLSTLFPEVRLKRFLEMRGADVGPTERIAALSAFWTGLLYDDAALDGAWELVKGWGKADRQALRDKVPRQGLNAMIGNRSVRDVARDALALSSRGLAARAQVDALGRDETVYLAPIEEIVASGRTAAEDLVAKFSSEWHGSVAPAFRDLAY
jgi:glutamate--cysteine ligase